MKQIITKISAVFIALAVMLSCAVTAFAAEDYKITVENTNQNVSIDGSEFSAYKLFNVSYNKTTNSYNYTFDKSCISVEYTLSGKTHKSSDGTLADYLENASDDEVRAFADYAYASYIKGGSVKAASTATASGESAVISLTEPGYYLTYGAGTADDSATVTAAVSLSTTDPSATVNPKFDAPTISAKQIKDNTAGTWGNVGDNQIGDTVEYRVITTVPDTTGYSAYKYIVHDKMTSGLTYTDGSVALYTDAGKANELAAKYYTVTTSTSDECTFEVSVDILSAIKDGALSAADAIYTYYSAVLNENAVVYTDGHNDNTALLEYSNSPYDSASTGKTHKVTAYDWTFTMGLNKIDDNNNALTGAQFVIATGNDKSKAIALIDNGNGVYTVAPSDYAGKTTTTIAAGSVTIKGLDDSVTYYLFETKAPDFEPYLLRHTFCTDCQAAGVPINVAKEWMGHSDISVTAKIYTHMVDEVFEQNRIRMAQYAVTKSQQVESQTATN